jgi:hypothetical protein
MTATPSIDGTICKAGFNNDNSRIQQHAKHENKQQRIRLQQGIGQED